MGVGVELEVNHTWPHGQVAVAYMVAGYVGSQLIDTSLPVIVVNSRGVA